MRFVYFCACALIAWGMAERAVGASPEHILTPDFLWLNWVGAALWLAYGLYAFVWMPR